MKIIIIIIISIFSSARRVFLYLSYKMLPVIHSSSSSTRSFIPYIFSHSSIHHTCHLYFSRFLCPSRCRQLTLTARWSSASETLQSALHGSSSDSCELVTAEQFGAAWVTKLIWGLRSFIQTYLNMSNSIVL